MTDDLLQRNIRHTTGLHALKQMRAIVDEERRDDAAKAGVLRWMMRYGWIILLAVAALLARLTGVY